MLSKDLDQMLEFWPSLWNKFYITFFLQSYLFIFALLGLLCYMQTFSSCGKQWLLSSCHVRASHSSGFSCYRAEALEHKVSSSVSWAQLHPGMWNLLGPGIKAPFPVLACEFLTHGPPGKPHNCLYILSVC